MSELVLAMYPQPPRAVRSQSRLVRSSRLSKIPIAQLRHSSGFYIPVIIKSRQGEWWMVDGALERQLSDRRLSLEPIRSERRCYVMTAEVVAKICESDRSRSPEVLGEVSV